MKTPKQNLHTPGPWSVDVHDRLGRYTVRPKGAADAVWSTDEVLANGRLIACAPELLEALKEVLFVLSVSISPQTHHRRNAEIQAERAIAKATGGAE